MGLSLIHICDYGLCHIALGGFYDNDFWIIIVIHCAESFAGCFLEKLLACLPFHSPSEIGGSAEIKPINFDHKTKASDTGNLYHKLTELLPSADWTAELIEETGKRLNVTIPSGIIKNLIALNGNEIFRSTFAMTVHHEMPFQVLIENQLMHGYMDYVAMDDSKIILIDFKSDQKLTDHQLHLLYDEQLAAYVLSLIHI